MSGLFTNFVLHASKCTNNCVFCSKRNFGDIKKNIEQEFEKLENLIQKGQYIETVEISGNDPVEYPSLPKLVSRINQVLNPQCIILHTHGKGLSDEGLLDALIESGITDFMIPFYGHIPQVHDAVTRSPGSFELTFKGVENIVNRQQPIRLSTLITKENQNSLKELFVFLSNFTQSFVVGVPHFPFTKRLQSWRYKKSIPLFSELRSLLSEAVLQIIIEANCYPMIKDLPYCMLNFEYHCRSKNTIPTSGYEHWRKERYFKNKYVYEIAGDIIPVYRMMTKGKECGQCHYDEKCDGFLLTYVNKKLFAFQPILSPLLSLRDTVLAQEKQKMMNTIFDALNQQLKRPPKSKELLAALRR